MVILKEITIEVKCNVTWLKPQQKLEHNGNQNRNKLCYKATWHKW